MSARSASGRALLVSRQSQGVGMESSKLDDGHARERTKRTVVLIDGSNVAHSSEGERAQLANILAVCERLREEGYEPLVLVDAALRHQIDDRDEYERLVEKGEI